MREETPLGSWREGDRLGSDGSTPPRPRVGACSSILALHEAIDAILHDENTAAAAACHRSGRPNHRAWTAQTAPWSQGKARQTNDSKEGKIRRLAFARQT